jgi:hypothetical protein
MARIFAEILGRIVGHLFSLGLRCPPLNLGVTTFDSVALRLRTPLLKLGKVLSRLETFLMLLLLPPTGRHTAVYARTPTHLRLGSPTSATPIGPLRGKLSRRRNATGPGDEAEAGDDPSGDRSDRKHFAD